MSDEASKVHTGIFTSMRRVGRRQIIGGKPDIREYIEASLGRELALVTGEAIDDGRTYVVKIIGIEEIDRMNELLPIMEYRKVALVLLLEPGEAEIGDFVATERINSDEFPPRTWCMKRPEWQEERTFEYARFGYHHRGKQEYRAWQRIE